MDLFIDVGYPYDLNINMNTAAGTDLEQDYSCYFECDSIGQLQFTVANSRYELEISATDTDKLTTMHEEYVVYAIKTADSKPEKLLSGRIYIDERVRA